MEVVLLFSSAFLFGYVVGLPSTPLVSRKGSIACAIMVGATIVCGAAAVVPAPQPLVWVCLERLSLDQL